MRRTKAEAEETRQRIISAAEQVFYDKGVNISGIELGMGGVWLTCAPHLVFIQDPVAGTSYTLNLTDKTAWKNPTPPAGKGGPGGTFFVHTEGGMPPLPPPPPGPTCPL